MSKKGTSQTKAKNGTTIWVLTIFFSPYKEESEIDCRSFVSKELALGAMKREARRLYKNSDIIQEADDKYFEEYLMEIHFGESPDESDYRREYGFCKVESAKLEDVESGNDVLSSTDEESEDED